MTPLNSCRDCGARAELSDDGRCVACYDRIVDRDFNNGGKKDYQRRWYLANRERVIAHQAAYREQRRQLARHSFTGALGR